MFVVALCASLKEHAVVHWGGDEVAGVGEGNFDRQEESLFYRKLYTREVKRPGTPRGAVRWHCGRVPARRVRVSA